MYCSVASSLCDVGQARLGAAGQPEAAAEPATSTMASDERDPADDLHATLLRYGNFLKYGTVSCSVSATVQRLAAMNA